MPRFDGADVSHYQSEAGPIHWPTLRTVSSWVATKATQHTGYVDPYLKAHRAEMATQGFKHRGLYHWLSPQRKWLWGSFAWRPEDQAAHFLRTIGTLEPGEFAMLDAEEGGITAADVLVWCEAVEDVTRRPVSVYTGAYVAGGTIWQSTSIRHSDYGQRPMHLAAYTTEAKALALPGVKAYPWSAWQFSSDGPVPGVVGRCDMNRVDDLAVYDIAAGVIVEPPPVPPNPPQEDEMPTKIWSIVGVPDVELIADTSRRCVWADPANSRYATLMSLLRAADPEVDAQISKGNLVFVRLDGGALPTGMDPDDFINGDEIREWITPVAAVDQTARDRAQFAIDEHNGLEDRYERCLHRVVDALGG